MFYQIEISELKKGNIEICDLIGSDGIYDIFSHISQEEKDEILSIILPKLKNTKDWHSVAEGIFDFIYLDDKYEEYTRYLLNNNLEKASYLTPTQIKNILTKKSWGLSYIMSKLEEIISGYKIYPEPLTELIVERVKDNHELLNTCFNRFLYSKNTRLRETAIFFLAKKDLLPSKDLVVAALYKNPDDFLLKKDTPEALQEKDELLLSDLPYLISVFAEQDSDYQDIIKQYYDQFFAAESKRKLHFFKKIGYISKKTEKKYREILRMADDPMIMNNLDFILTSIINANEESFIIDCVKGKNIEFEGMGTTRKVFKVGDDYVLKFARHLHCKDNVTEHFLLAPTQLKIINTENSEPIYIEKENYLSKIYNGKKMTKEDIENFLIEADKQGLVISDPHCLRKEDDNFGFLKSYKDATLVGVNSHDELPEWFKKRPLVLYDIDMVSYRKEKSKQLVKI